MAKEDELLEEDLLEEDLLDEEEARAEEESVEDLNEPDEPEAKAKPEEQHTMPVSSHVQERNQWRQERQALLDRLKATESIGEELKRLREAGQKPPAPQEPDYEAAPMDYLRHRTDQTAEEIKQWKEDQAKQRQEAQRVQQQQEQIRQFTGTIQMDEQNFAKQNADYYDALNFVREKNAQLLRVQGVPEEQILRARQQSEIQQAAYALQNGMSPAQVAYKIAETMGYSPKPGDESGLDQEAVNEVERHERKRKASTNVRSGKTGKVQELLDADASEFDAAMKELFG